MKTKYWIFSVMILLSVAIYLTFRSGIERSKLDSFALELEKQSKTDIESQCNGGIIKESLGVYRCYKIPGFIFEDSNGYRKYLVIVFQYSSMSRARMSPLNYSRERYVYIMDFPIHTRR